MTDESEAIFEETIRINTYECDTRQNWKPAAFFQHMTETAHLHSIKLGVGFDELFANDLTWVHSRMKIQFYRFPQVDEIVTIRTWPKTIQQKLFYVRDFEVLDTNEQRLAASTSSWLIINTRTRRLVPPRSLSFTLPILEDRHGLDETLEKLDLEQVGEERLREQASYSTIDIVGHVNNSRYVEWICDAFPMEMYAQHQLDWIQVNYDHEILPGEEVSVLVNSLAPNDGLWSVQGHNRSNDTRAFEAKLHWKN
jgi:acyl-ACP thioesterase